MRQLFDGDDQSVKQQEYYASQYCGEPHVDDHPVAERESRGDSNAQQQAEPDPGCGIVFAKAVFGRNQYYIVLLSYIHIDTSTPLVRGGCSMVNIASQSAGD